MLLKAILDSKSHLTLLRGAHLIAQYEHSTSQHHKHEGGQSCRLPCDQGQLVHGRAPATYTLHDRRQHTSVCQTLLGMTGHQFHFTGHDAAGGRQIFVRSSPTPALARLAGTLCTTVTLRTEVVCPDKGRKRSESRSASSDSPKRGVRRPPLERGAVTAMHPLQIHL
jgi:hypothetical protein